MARFSPALGPLQSKFSKDIEEQSRRLYLDEALFAIDLKFNSHHFFPLSSPRTTEDPACECGDEPRSNSATRELHPLYPARLERGECSELSRRAAPQSHGRKSVVRGLQIFLNTLSN